MTYNIPQKDTKPKKTYNVTIEGDTYTVKASVLIAKEATHYYNALQKAVSKLNDGLEELEKVYDNMFSLFDILLGEKKARKLIEKIDDKYDTESAQEYLLKCAVALYSISSGANQESIDNIFFEQKTE